MRSLSNLDFLDLWERGLGFHPLDQGLRLLSKAFPGISHDALADWPLGRCNQALAELHCAWFGPNLHAWTDCIKCGEKLEAGLL